MYLDVTNVAVRWGCAGLFGSRGEGSEDCLVDGKRLVAKSCACAGGWLGGYGERGRPVDGWVGTVQERDGLEGGRREWSVDGWVGTLGDGVWR